MRDRPNARQAPACYPSASAHDFGKLGDNDARIGGDDVIFHRRSLGFDAETELPLLARRDTAVVGCQRRGGSISLLPLCRARDIIAMVQASGLRLHSIAAGDRLSRGRP